METVLRTKKILWPNDLSKCSESVLPYVKSLAEKYNAEVHVLYVAEDLAHHKSWYGDFSPQHVEKIMQWEQKRASERQLEICRKHLEDCARYFRHIAVGEPAREILNFIEVNKIDLVVMCRKGEQGDFDMGGVAQKIAAHSPVPVLIGPNAGDDGSAP